MEIKIIFLLILAVCFHHTLTLKSCCKSIQRFPLLSFTKTCQYFLQSLLFPLVLPIIDSSIPFKILLLSPSSYKLYKTQSVPDLLAGLLLTAIRRTNHGFHRHLVVKMGFGQVEVWGKLVLSLSHSLLPSSTLVCKP